MECLQSLRLSVQYPRCRHDNHHVDVTVGMMVLVGDVINIFCLRERRAAERGSRCWLVGVQRDIVETYRTSALRCYLHAVLVFQTINHKCLLRRITCIVCAKCYGESSYHRVVYRHLGSGIAACRKHYLHLSGVGSTLSGYGISLVGTEIYRSVLEEIAAAAEPCVVVYLVQGVIVVCLGIVRRQKLVCTDAQRCLVALCYKVIAIVGIGVANAHITAVPRHWSLRIEESSAVNSARGHLLQVVQGYKFLADKFFVLQSTAIAINLNLVKT